MTTTLSLTYEEREKLAHRYGLTDPNALTPEDIVSGERLFAESGRDRDVEREYLSLLGVVEPREREYGERLSTGEQQWSEFAAALGIKASA